MYELLNYELLTLRTNTIGWGSPLIIHFSYCHLPYSTTANHGNLTRW